MNGTANIIDQVNEYYRETAWDYKYLWIGTALGVHFGYYDKNVKTHNSALLRMNEFMAEAAHIQNGERILDAGCGMGGSSLWLAKNKQCKVVGVNIVDAQLKEASVHANKSGIGGVDFIQADYAELPFAERSFHVFWALESLVHAINKAAVVREAYRVLDVGGRIIIAEYMLRENPGLDKGEKNFLTAWLRGWSMPSLLTVSEYEHNLKSVGFSSIAKFDISSNIRPSLMRLKWICRFGLPPAIVMESLGLFTKQRVMNIKGSLRQIEAFERGYWKYFILVGTKTG